MTPSTAKFRLYNRSPFWGSILFNLPVVEDADGKILHIPTAGVDGDNLYINPQFWGGLTDKQQLGLLCHEVGHLFLGHLWRKGNRNEVCIEPKSGQTVMLWNLACDVVVNNMIVAEGRFELPGGSFVKAELQNKSTEEVYEILKKQIPSMSKKDLQDLIDSQYNDKSQWSKKDGKKQSKQEAKDSQAKWSNIGKQAIEKSKSQGKLPRGIERMFDDMEPKEDWRQILLSYVQPFWNDYSFNPTDRRFLEEEFALPDIKMGEKIDWLAIAVDTSGSIGEKELNSFLSEVKAILGRFASHPSFR